MLLKSLYLQVSVWSMQGNVQVSVSYWGTCLTWDVMNLKPPPTHDEFALHAMEEVAGPNRRVEVDLPVD